MSDHDHDEDRVIVTRGEMQEIADRSADRAAERAVTSAFERLGIDHGDPRETQADFRYLRSLRTMQTMVGRRVIITAVSILVGGTLAILSLGVVAWVKGE